MQACRVLSCMRTHNKCCHSPNASATSTLSSAFANTSRTLCYSCSACNTAHACDLKDQINLCRSYLATYVYICIQYNRHMYNIILTCAFKMLSSSICGCSNELATLLIVLACSMADTTISLGLLDVLT